MGCVTFHMICMDFTVDLNPCLWVCTWSMQIGWWLVHRLFKRLRATAGQGPNYVGPSCGYRLAYVGLPCGAKRSEKWEQQKNAVKRRIFWWSVAYLGAMLAYLEGNVGPSWGLLALLGAMLAHLAAMLAYLEAYVGPCWPILSHKIRKMGKNGKSTKHCKTRDFLAGGRGRQRSAAGAAAPLSYGEERNAYGNATARGPLAGFKRLRATAGQGPNYVGPSCGYMLAYGGLMLTHVERKDPKNGNSKKTL